MDVDEEHNVRIVSRSHLLYPGWKSSSWMLVNSIPWRRMKRSEALASGTERRAWAACDQMERIDSRDVRNGCRVVILHRE